MPWCLLLNRDSLETGQLIKPRIFFSLTNLSATLKHLKMYLFDLFDICSKGFCQKPITDIDEFMDAY